MVRISSTEKGGGLFLKLCDFKGKSLSPSFLDCSFLSVENRSHGCSKDPPGKGQQAEGLRVVLPGGTELTDIGGHPCPQSPHEKICLQPRKVTSAKQFHTVFVFQRDRTCRQRIFI